MATAVTLLTLRGQLRHLLDDENSKIYSNGRLLTALNLATEHIEDIFTQWDGKGLMARATINLVAPTVEYSIDNNIKHIEKVTVLRSDGTERGLDPIPFSHTEDYVYTTGNTTGYVPLYYYRQGTKIGFLPAPVVAQTGYVYHPSMQVPLAGDSDALAMPAWVRRALLWKAAAYAAATKADKGNGAVFEAQYREAAQQLEYQLAHWQKHEPERIGMAWDDDMSTMVT
jgi:hypothetical protein